MSLDGVRRRLLSGDLDAGRLLPPLVERRGGSFAVLGYSAGSRSPGLVAEAFSAPRFAPWRAALAEFSRFSASSGGWARLLSPWRGGVHGEVSRTVYALCTLSEGARPRGLARFLARRHLKATALMLRRLERDFGGPAAVLGLELADGDSHRGGQQVARVALRGGGVWAYKPRPVDAEALLLGEGVGSAAERVNALLASEGLGERLPLLRVRRGAGADGRHYGYVGWVDAAPGLRRLVRGRHAARAVRASRAEAGPLWRDAGLLAAFAFAFGVEDLHDGNLVAARSGDGGLRYHPIDVELVGGALADLEGTLLVSGSVRHGEAGHLHPGFPDSVMLCGREADQWGFRRRGGRWALEKIQQVVPEELPATVFDPAGRVGYRAYLPQFLAGLLRGFDLLSRRRSEVLPRYHRDLGRACSRVLARATAVYGADLLRRLEGAPAPRVPRFSPTERAQLEAFDVPYYFRRGGGPVLHYADYPRRVRPAGSIPAGRPPLRRDGARLGPDGFAVLLQDALDHVLEAETPLRFEAEGLALLRRRGSPETLFAGRAGGRLWTVRIDAARGAARVEVRPDPASP